MSLIPCNCVICHRSPCHVPWITLSLAIDNFASCQPALLDIFHNDGNTSQAEVTFQEQLDEDLDVIAAFAKNPNAVRDALCEAICHVALPPSEFKLLSIASSFRSALQKPWEGYKPLRGVLEACRQKKYGRPTERLFHEHSQEAGVVALGLVAKHQNKLIDEIDALSEAESIKLAKLVKRIPKKAVIHEFIDGFLSSKGK